MTTKRKSKPRVRAKKSGLYFFKSGMSHADWYWHLTARNGRIVAGGAEGYSSEAKARQGFKSAARLAAKALSELEAK